MRQPPVEDIQGAGAGVGVVLLQGKMVLTACTRMEAQIIPITSAAQMSLSCKKRQKTTENLLRSMEVKRGIRKLNTKKVLRMLEDVCRGLAINGCLCGAQPWTYRSISHLYRIFARTYHFFLLFMYAVPCLVFAYSLQIKVSSS